MTIAGKKIGFAVVGLGSIAQGAVLPAFAHCKKARLVALVSRDRQKAARLSRNFKNAAFYGAEDYFAYLANPEVQAVYVATPQGSMSLSRFKRQQPGNMCSARSRWQPRRNSPGA